MNARGAEAQLIKAVIAGMHEALMAMVLANALKLGAGLDIVGVKAIGVSMVVIGEALNRAYKAGVESGIEFSGASGVQSGVESNDGAGINAGVAKSDKNAYLVVI